MGVSTENDSSEEYREDSFVSPDSLVSNEEDNSNQEVSFVSPDPLVSTEDDSSQEYQEDSFVPPDSLVSTAVDNSNQDYMDEVEGNRELLDGVILNGTIHAKDHSGNTS